MGYTSGSQFQYQRHQETKKDKFEFYINDELQGELEDGDYKTGAVGAWCWQSKAGFDDVMVEGDTVTNTLAVDPQSKLSTTWSSIKTRPWKQYFLDQYSRLSKKPIV